MTRAVVALVALVLLAVPLGLTAAGASTLTVRGGVAEQRTSDVDCGPPCGRTASVEPGAAVTVTGSGGE